MAKERLKSADCLERFEDGGFVEVMYAKSQGEATECCGLLAERDIPARIECAAGAAPRLGVAVLVPRNRLVEASELLAAHVRDDDDDEFDDDDDLADDDDDEGEDEDDFEDEEAEDEEDLAEEDEEEEYEELEDDDHG